MSLDLDKFDYSQNLQDQRNLFSHCFPENEGTVVEKDEHYLWKFQNFPNAEKKSYEYIARSEGEIIGYYAAIPYQYNIQGEPMTAGMVCDVMTHSKMRGKGVFTKLGKYSTDQFKEEGLNFSTGYPIRDAVIPGHLKVGWEVAFELPMFINVLKSNAILKSKRLSLFSPILNFCISIFHLLLDLLFQKKVDDLKVECFDWETFDDWSKYSDFFSKWSESQKHFLVKDQNFLKWRLGAPESKYKFITLKHKHNIVGVAIGRVKEFENIPSLAILDYMILEDYVKYSTYFFKEIKKISKQLHVETIVCMLSQFWKKKYCLSKSGFLKSPFIFKIIFKELNLPQSIQNFSSEENWHLMWIDSDDL